MVDATAEVVVEKVFIAAAHSAVQKEQVQFSNGTGVLEGTTPPPPREYQKMKRRVAVMICGDYMGKRRRWIRG